MTPKLTLLIEKVPRLGRRVAAACAFVALACGSQVDSGSNVERAKSQPQTGGDADTTESGEDGNADSSSGGTTRNAGGSSGAALACFGSAPELPANLTAFCQSMSGKHRALFPTAVNLICTERKLVNLFLPACSWDGDKATMNSYFRILQATDVKDTASTDFYFLASFSLTAPSPVEKFVELLYGRYSDPNFAQRYLVVPNTKIVEASTDPANGLITYEAQVITSSSTASFRGQMDIQTITPDLRVVFDYSVETIQLIKSHRYLIFYAAVDNATTRMVVIDEKLVADSGNHSIARSTALDVDRKRMEIGYENARRD